MNPDWAIESRNPPGYRFDANPNTICDAIAARFGRIDMLINTGRLCLRPITKGDFEADYAVVGSDPRVTWNHKAQSRVQAQIALKKRLRHWTDHGFGMYAVIEKVTQQLIGHGGLQQLEETSDVELGYYLGWPPWGRGFATELSRAVLRYGFDVQYWRIPSDDFQPQNGDYKVRPALTSTT